MGEKRYMDIVKKWGDFWGKGKTEFKNENDQPMVVGCMSAFSARPLGLWDRVHVILIFVFPASHSGTGAWEVFNKYYLNDLINKYKAFNECQ